LRNLFDPSSPVLKPTDIVRAFTGKNLDELQLPRRAIITFNSGDLNAILKNIHQKPIKSWACFRRLFRITSSETIVTRCYFGGPNVAALVEELSAFGVREFVLWGYCGGISDDISIGDLLIAEGALRHDGVSYHYLNGNDEFVYSSWFAKWRKIAVTSCIVPSLIWSCDALYRETRDKINRHKRMGIHAVEMEIASFYAVCKAKKLKGIAFLVVSDLFRLSKWKPGFFEEPFKEGVRRLREFILEQGIKR
jgi:nucleoside phosphorylase